MYKWKPNASQKREYIEKMKEKDTLPIIRSYKAIRTGCELEWYSIAEGRKLSGKVLKHSYGEIKNQHTFTILLKDGSKKLVKGRNLYPNLLGHIQGEESKKL